VVQGHGVQRLLDMAGAVFFRIRSFAPLPVIFVVLWQSWRAHVHPGPGGADVDRALNFVGLGLCFGGAFIRFATVGFIPAGTSSTSRQLQSHALNTGGPYAVVRHPLYLGNLFITVGLLCIAHDPWAWTLGFGYFLLSHLLIIRAEEALLRRTFAAQYDEWAARVPGWLPRLSALMALSGPFGWKRAIQREVNPLVGWGMGATVLFMWESFARSQLTPALARRGQLGLGLFLLLLIVNKMWKKWSRA
jgi:protein-S-isoprenylcysteine O-methyltransferase Ste14